MAVHTSPARNLLTNSIIPVLLILCAALSFGLTFAPCYSSLCVEKFWPYQARIHIALYYTLLASIALFLAARVVSKPVRQWSSSHLSTAIIPLVGKRVSVGGLLLFVWVAAFTFGSIGYWYPAENSYWTARGEKANWPQYMYRITWTGVTGHWCDILMGLVILPVGRQSILGQVFGLHVSTLLFAHKVLAYSLCIAALVHGLIYYSFVAAWVSIVSTNIMYQFIPDNPTLTWREAGVKGPYSWFTLPTGAISGIVLIPIMVITSLPVLRRINYNTFYYIHVVFATAVIVLVSLHASTSFYFLLPGLILWLADWAWRVRNALGRKVEARVQNASNGWYRITLPAKEAELEKGDSAALTEATPDLLSTYYVNMPSVSRLQIHPFTAAAIGHGSSPPVLLFQKGPERKKAKQRDFEWTWKLGALVDVNKEEAAPIPARLEGPYTPKVPSLYAADHILAVVGGTGITGALCIANWWAAKYSSLPAQTKSFRLVWTIRDRATAQVEEVQQLQALMRGAANMEFHVHVSSSAGRLDAEEEVRGFVGPRKGARQGKVWVYVSGPEGLLARVETACVKEKKELSRGERSGGLVSGLEWYVARWSL
ncbi:hypothetical protein LTR35_009259 [Friedmanniomyces endolithicus]|uniref:Ferric oxidoreductase domain-containing protein n=1 Tax=Friedmanniomyces endolithicus TaxID=329885 RepID=A0AAN6J8H1_9PEZI|nr:hypothetical protein LTR35_009259 [Friedmanniomyces endolithicus]KAK0292319.1 hypothetical protein LTS00_008154 [Friedmanniomyces endolithicus]KAK0320315.1 hypothetical protein LTR82_008832 [Friedmanniomyces endolithicus]